MTSLAPVPSQLSFGTPDYLYNQEEASNAEQDRVAGLQSIRRMADQWTQRATQMSSKMQLKELRRERASITTTLAGLWNEAGKVRDFQDASTRAQEETALELKRNALAVKKRVIQRSMYGLWLQDAIAAGKSCPDIEKLSGSSEIDALRAVEDTLWRRAFRHKIRGEAAEEIVTREAVARNLSAMKSLKSRRFKKFRDLNKSGTTVIPNSSLIDAHTESCHSQARATPGSIVQSDNETSQGDESSLSGPVQFWKSELKRLATQKQLVVPMVKEAWKRVNAEELVLAFGPIHLTPADHQVTDLASRNRLLHDYRTAADSVLQSCHRQDEAGHSIAKLQGRSCGTIADRDNLRQAREKHRDIWDEDFEATLKDRIAPLPTLERKTLMDGYAAERSTNQTEIRRLESICGITPATAASSPLTNNSQVSFSGPTVSNPNRSPPLSAYDSAPTSSMAAVPTPTGRFEDEPSIFASDPPVTSAESIIAMARSQQFNRFTDQQLAQLIAPYLAGFQAPPSASTVPSDTATGRHSIHTWKSTMAQSISVA